MATVFTVPFSQNPGTRTFGPAQVKDSITTIRITIAAWTGVGTLAATIEMSLDGGNLWRQVCATGPVSNTQLDFKGRNAYWLQIDGLWKMCQCGEVYVPGHPANAQLMVHSSHKGQNTAGWKDLSGVTFHNPDNSPAVGLPERLVRATVVVAGAAISSTLVLDVT